MERYTITIETDSTKSLGQLLRVLSEFGVKEAVVSDTTPVKVRPQETAPVKDTPVKIRQSHVHSSHIPPVAEPKPVDMESTCLNPSCGKTFKKKYVNSICCSPKCTAAYHRKKKASKKR